MLIPLPIPSADLEAFVHPAQQGGKLPYLVCKFGKLGFGSGLGPDELGQGLGRLPLGLDEGRGQFFIEGPPSELGPR